MGYRIHEYRGHFYVTYKEKKIGSFCEDVEQAKSFIEEHKKMRKFNIERITEETK